MPTTSRTASRRRSTSFPNAFTVGRQQTRPRGPALAVTASGADMATMQMTLTYMATPVWDPQRLVAAGPALQQALGLGAPPSLALFQATDTALHLDLPAADPAAGVVSTPQTAALVDLPAGIKGFVTMGAAQFRQVCNALFDMVSGLLEGEVRVTIASDTTSIPFRARIAEVTDNLVDVNVAVDATANAMVVTLENAIECPIQVHALSGVIARGDHTLPSSVAQTTPALPADLQSGGADAASQPGGKLIIVLAPSSEVSMAQTTGALLGGPLSGGRPTGQQILGAAAGLASQVLDAGCRPVLDLGKLVVVPDPKATWRSIMQDGSAAPVVRAVTLKVVSARLTKIASNAAPQASQADSVSAIQVVFKSGQTATFDASQPPDAAGFLDRTVNISVPIQAFVLGNEAVDSYAYRTVIVTGSGIKQGTWTTDNRDTLFIVPA